MRGIFVIQKGKFFTKVYHINQWIYGNSNPSFRMLQINRNVVLCFVYYLLDYTLKGLISSKYLGQEITMYFLCISVFTLQFCDTAIIKNMV